MYSVPTRRVPRPRYERESGRLTATVCAPRGPGRALALPSGDADWLPSTGGIRAWSPGPSAGCHTEPVTWMTLNVHRTAKDAEWLRSAFPLELADYRAPHLGLNDPTRELDWVLRTPGPQAWVNVDTGSLILIESVGGESEGAGTVLARLWLAPASQFIELAEPRHYSDWERPGVLDHHAAKRTVTEQAASRMPGFPTASSPRAAGGNA